MVSYQNQHFNQQPQSTLPYLLLGVFCVLFALVIRYGWEYLMWLWNNRQPTQRHRGDSLGFSSVRAAPAQRRKVLKKPVEYYEEPEDEYDDFDQE